tara:strand:- start:370 stop:678 length:309 start_codon:yes stop_codon:yes gene_type:complete
MEKVQKIVEQINYLKRENIAYSGNEEKIRDGEFEIMSKHFPGLREEIIKTNKNIDWEFATTIGQLLTDDLTLSKWIILKEFIEGRNQEYDVMGSFDENGDLI